MKRQSHHSINHHSSVSWKLSLRLLWTGLLKMRFYNHSEKYKKNNSFKSIWEINSPITYNKLPKEIKDRKEAHWDQLKHSRDITQVCHSLSGMKRIWEVEKTLLIMNQWILISTLIEEMEPYRRIEVIMDGSDQVTEICHS